MSDQREELPPVRWRAKVSSSMDRREQLRLYTEAVDVDAAQRQVRLHREQQAREAWRRRKLRQRQP